MFYRILIVVVAAFVVAVPAAAQNYPTRPVRFIVPFAPGGNTDVQGRLIAQKLTEKWNQQVVVDNRAGAGGTLGVEMLAKAPADGYTIALASFGNILVGPSLFPKLAYDPMKDLAPVVLVSQPPGLLVVNPALPVKNVGELIAYGKANAGKLNYGSAGNGTSHHLVGELFKMQAGVELTHVPYRGAGPLMQDLLAGVVDLAFDGMGTSAPQIKAGKLRPLAVTSPTRSPVIPNVPTLSESGFADFKVTTWYALWAIKGTPKEIVDRMHQEIAKALQNPDVKNVWEMQGAVAGGQPPAEFAKFIRAEIETWGKVVKQANLKVDL